MILISILPLTDSPKLFGELLAATKVGVREGLSLYGELIVKHASDRIRSNSGKSGKVYRVRIRGSVRVHQASAPGQYPANMRGRLARSIKARMKAKGVLEFGTAGTDYGRSLELGRASNRMAARPFLLPTLRAAERRGAGIISKQMAKHIRAAL